MPGEQTTGTAAGATPGSSATQEQAVGGSASTDATSAAASTADQPATGEEALGDKGNKVLSEARKAAKDAEKRATAAEEELAKLREETASDSEKALNQARRDAAAERDAFWHSRIREAEVRGALRGAGITNEKFLALAVAAPEFRELKVTDAGSVEGVGPAIEGFKTDYPEAFAPKEPPEARQDGHWDGAAGGGSGGKKPATLEEAVEAEIAGQFKRK